MKLQTEVFDCIVIGGGASGMMAALEVRARGKSVLILEKNKSLGEKLKISGGGRCNITNADYDIHSLLSNYGEAKSFLYSPFAQFGVKDTFTYFESRGLPLVVQARNRAFPHTENAHDVCAVFTRAIASSGVAVKYNCTVKALVKDGDAITRVQTNQGDFVAKSYILATGGMSHPETGSTGDGFEWLRELGHTVKSPTPTIVPLAVKEEWIKSLSGTSLSFMKITFFVEGKRAFNKIGKVLFTHFGLSGPLILNCAQKVSDLLQSGVVTATIDAYPDTDIGALEKKILNAFDANKNKMLKTIWKDIVPEGTSDALMTLFPAINFETKVHSVSKEERKLIAQTLKALPVTISGLMGYDRAVVADGGVPLTEIDMKTMRSKSIRNLYITGDLLHINRPSGGFSLQLCWTTGYVAGNSVE